MEGGRTKNEREKRSLPPIPRREGLRVHGSKRFGMSGQDGLGIWVLGW